MIAKQCIGGYPAKSKYKFNRYNNWHCSVSVEYVILLDIQINNKHSTKNEVFR